MNQIELIKINKREIEVIDTRPVQKSKRTWLDGWLDKTLLPISIGVNIAMGILLLLILYP